MKSKRRWLLLLVPLALLVWAFNAASWRPKLIGVQPTVSPFGGLRPLRLSAFPLSRLLLSPDGKRLVSCGNDDRVNFILLWDVASRRMLWQRKRDFNAWLSPLAFSPDGRTLAVDETFVNSNENLNQIILLDVSTGKTRRDIGYAVMGSLQSAAFLSNRELVVSTTQGAKVVDVQTGDTIRNWKFNLPVLPNTKLPAPPQSHISADGTTVLSLQNSDSQTFIAIYDVRTGHKRGSWSYKGVFRNPRLSPDGKLWVGASQKTSMSDAYDAVTGKKLWGPFAGGTQPWIWGADSRRLVIGGSNVLVTVEARTGKESQRAPGSPDFQALTLAPNDDYFYTLDDNGKIYRWRAR